MEVTVSLVDWDWVQSAPSTRYLLEVMFDQDDADIYFRDWSCDFRWGDSAVFYGYFFDAFPEVLKEMGEGPQSLLLRDGLWPFFKAKCVDDIGVCSFPEECYFASLSPKTIEKMYNLCSDLELSTVASVFIKFMPSYNDAWHTTEGEIVDYLTQWREALKEAANARNVGLLAHIG